MNKKKHSFPPVVGENPKILILGSMPGEESLRQQQYYAFPQNVFWKIMGELFGFSREIPYEERLEILKKNGIALWDSLASCRREGSLDTKITNPVPNDILSLVKKNPSIRKILCNGSASWNFLKRYNPAVFDLSVEIKKLPSTSPAAARFSYERKLAEYRDQINPQASV